MYAYNFKLNYYVYEYLRCELALFVFLLCEPKWEEK